MGGHTRLAFRVRERTEKGGGCGSRVGAVPSGDRLRRAPGDHGPSENPWRSSFVSSPPWLMDAHPHTGGAP